MFLEFALQRFCLIVILHDYLPVTCTSLRCHVPGQRKVIKDIPINDHASLTGRLNGGKHFSDYGVKHQLWVVTCTRCVTRGFFSSNLSFQKKCFERKKKCGEAAGDDCVAQLKCLKRLGFCLHRHRPGKPGDSDVQSDEFGAEHAKFLDILEDEEMEDAHRRPSRRPRPSGRPRPSRRPRPTPPKFVVSGFLGFGAIVNHYRCAFYTVSSYLYCIQ